MQKAAEKKHFDDISQLAGGLLDQWELVSAGEWPIQGISQTERIGKSITLKSLQFRFYFSMNEAGGEDYDRIRLVIFAWRDETSIVPSRVLESSTSQWKFITPLNRESLQSGLLVPMYDRQFQLNRTTRPAISLKLMFSGRRLPNKKKVFLGNTAAPTSYNYIVYVTSDSILAPHPNMRFWRRITYVDS